MADSKKTAPAAPDPKPARVRVGQITVEVLKGDKPVVHPLTGAPLEPGAHLTVQANFADVMVRTKRAKYLRREDHPRVRSGEIKLDAPKE